MYKPFGHSYTNKTISNMEIFGNDNPKTNGEESFFYIYKTK